MSKPNFRVHLPLVLAALVLAGCGGEAGQAPQLPLAAPLAGSAAMASASAEHAPSALELKKLEASSPDELVEHAPVEPGMSALSIWPHPPKEGLGNFGKVEDTLWRGARPSDAGLEKLAGMGVKTIVNFENDKGAVEHEQAWAAAHAVKFVSIPLSVILPPKTAKIQQFIALAADPANRPLYFHCMQGRDRTGTAAFCFRVNHDGWNYEKSWSEMSSFHFHQYLLGLQAYDLWFAHTHRKPAAS